MRFAVHFFLMIGCLNAAESRTWTDVQNRKIEAKMIRLEGDSVILELSDGKTVPLLLSKLCAADIAYARAQSTEKKPDSSGSDGGNFADPWPERIKFSDNPEINVAEENAEQKRFVYESLHYRYNCDVRLASSVVKGFAIMFEATHQFCRTLPIGLDGGELTNGKFQIHLFETESDYLKAGGPENTTGVFITSKAAVLVPLSSLGVRKVGSGYMLDREKSSKTLPHELTHQLSPEAYFQPGAIGWFSEGIAEYIAVTPYRSGSYNVKNNHNDIIASATGYGAKGSGGWAIGKNVRLPNLKTFMLQSYKEFQTDHQIGYGGGLLITYYFLQMDGDGDAKRIKAFLKGLRDGKSGEDSLTPLLDGRTFEQLESDITKAWSRRGINFYFGAAP
ncbi:MAG: hypothetical protein H8M99_09525 [Gloeobacteraceae cyanobacterium ES-bin-144]|nr:hypothetical protein [Verrucomicrobiales bacterium]